MVHHGSPGPDAPPGALTAERLPQELRGTEVVRPEGKAVPAVVLRRCTPWRFFRLVSWAVPIPGQFPASWMSAGTERLHGHGLSPPGKTKSAQANDNPSLGSVMAQALVTVDAGSGASIFTSVSCPQRLHFRGRFRAVVSGRISSSFPLPHTGQMTHPFLMTSLPHRTSVCKPFRPISV